jgi:hypothetical protein
VDEIDPKKEAQKSTDNGTPKKQHPMLPQGEGRERTKLRPKSTEGETDDNQRDPANRIAGDTQTQPQGDAGSDHEPDDSTDDTKRVHGSRPVILRDER